ncbi:RNA polymerase sigma-70 factor (ECF subfamily) [Dongia mobilis]|uniref:RNA polymerase sigma-70 factor (ECF subfamily) n=2 Tax=Dongia mobilis TaxID=578943 RepID=A0A4V3DEC1_9PROT|nr:RNA polymerase sigma-70 factor (ECF subfamily) [Dongia mobilis]
MRSALDGDETAYRRLLGDLAGLLRGWIRRELARQGYNVADAEDIVQETLIAIHLKRGTWDRERPFLPWLRAISRHKMVDNLRRRGRRIVIPIEEFAEVLAAPEPEESLPADALDRHLAQLPKGQEKVVRAISVDGMSIAETAQHLMMKEGAVRVALHRGLTALARAARRAETT